jgi:hypothetical protein
MYSYECFAFFMSALVATSFDSTGTNVGESSSRFLFSPEAAGDGLDRAPVVSFAFSVVATSFTAFFLTSTPLSDFFVSFFT